MVITQENLSAKKVLLQQTIEAKQQMRNWLQAKIEPNDYAYMLAQNEDMRKMTHVLTQKILNPTPLNSLKTERTNVYVDLGMGLSAFWDEIRSNSSVDIENAMVLDSVLMNVEAGVDENINPSLRRQFLSKTGMSDEQLNTLLPIEETTVFEQKVQNELRMRICQDFGLDIDNPEDSVLIENLMQDTIESQPLPMCLDNEPMVDEMMQGRHTYEEMYGVSSEELYSAFAPEDAYFDGVQFPEYVEEYSMNENSVMYDSMVEFQDMLNGTVAENMASLEALDQQINESFNALSDADLEALQPQDDMLDQLAFSESDLDFANDLQDMQQK